MANIRMDLGHQRHIGKYCPYHFVLQKSRADKQLLNSTHLASNDLFLIVGLITNWQSSWRGWLGRLFNWDRINYRAVQKFGHALAAQPYSDQSNWLKIS